MVASIHSREIREQTPRLLPCTIAGTGLGLPARRIPTEVLASMLYPDRSAAEVQAKIGIHERRWIDEHEHAGSLATTAVKNALRDASVEPKDIGRLILVTQTGGDWRSPATANRVLEALNLSDTCDGFDINAACTGFLHGIEIAAMSVALSERPAVVVTVETFSRDLSTKAPRAMLIFADIAAAAVVKPGEKGSGFIGRWLRNNDALRGDVIWPLPAPVGDGPLHISTGGEVTPWHHFTVPASALADVARSNVVRATQEVLRQTGHAIADIDYFLPHQPNGPLYDAICDAAGATLSQRHRIVDRFGSIGAASVPASLCEAWHARPPKPGALTLLAAVGAGTSYGALLYRGPAK